MGTQLHSTLVCIIIHQDRQQSKFVWSYFMKNTYIAICENTNAICLAS